MLKIFRRGWRLGAFWNENRGGPWGGGGSGGSSGGGAGGGGDEGDSGGSGGSGGPRNPWGQPPRPRRAGGGGPGGSLDDLLRRGRDRFGGRFPPSDGRPYWLYGLIAFLLLWVLFTSVHRISPQERGVVTTFGRFSGTLSPGIGFSWPAPFGRVQKVDVRQVREFTIPRGESENLILTGDKNVIDLTYSVRWTVSDTDPQLYLFQMDEPDKTIEEVAESAMRSVVSRMTLDEAIGAGRSDIGERVRVTMQEMLTDYGVGVTVALVAVNRSAPPAPVNQAFLQVSAAQQEAQRYINDARAYALQLTARAQGEATAFDRIYAQYRLAPEVTRRRMYYETMERILSRIDSTIIEAPGITPYLPLPEIGRQAQPQAQPPAQGQTQGQAAQQPQQQQGGR